MIGHNYKSMEEFLNANGTSTAELNARKYYAYDFSAARDFIMQAKAATGLIYIIGDYDVDGLFSTEELNRVAIAFGCRTIRRIPKRISEGYGLNETIIDEIPENQWLITVDNGITAFSAIEKAKEKGIKIMILDHHLPMKNEDGSLKLPNADVIYDPHFDHAEWKDYCAAGVVYKLAEYCFGQCDFTAEIAVFAAMGTIADMVPLKGDNRQLVKYGLSLLNTKLNVPESISKLLTACSLSHIDEQDIGYKLGPIINACGRLDDDGAQFVSNYLAERDPRKLERNVLSLINENIRRQELTAEITEQVTRLLGDPNSSKYEHSICLNIPNIPEGLIGIIAGNIASDYNVPAFVVTNAHLGELKGSARGNDMINVKEVLDSNIDCYVNKNGHSSEKKYGGHEGAGGFSLNPEKFDTFKQSVESIPLNKKEKYAYDFDIKQSDIPMWYHIKSQYAPFGIGNPEPIFHIDCFEASPRYSKFSECIGSQKQHVKIFGAGCDALGFNLASQYQKINSPKRVELIGKIAINYHNGKQKIQFLIKELHKIERHYQPSAELDFLKQLANN